MHIRVPSTICIRSRAVFIKGNDAVRTGAMATDPNSGAKPIISYERLQFEKFKTRFVYSKIELAIKLPFKCKKYYRVET